MEEFNFRNQLRFDERDFLEFRRALLDFKSGIPINIIESQIMIASPETLNITFYDRFFGGDAYLVLAPSKAKYLNMESNVLSLARMKFSVVQDLVKYNFLPKVIEYSELEYPEILLHIPKLLKLLPCFIFRINQVEGFLSLRHTSITEYKHLLINSLEIVEKAELKLRNYIDNKIELIVFRSKYTGEEHYAIIVGNQNNFQTPPFVRVHSSCFTGDVLGSIACDCMDQLHYTIDFLARNGGGVITYISQEGRGIGLAAKLKAYNLQKNEDLDTFDANLALGFDADEREFYVAAQMLCALSIANVKLITNNPHKVKFLEETGIAVEGIENITTIPNDCNQKYLKAKSEKMGHIINV